MREHMTSKRYFLFHKIYNLFLEKFLIRVSLVHAFLIKRLQRDGAESAPKCCRASKIRIINMAIAQISFNMEESVE